MAVNVVSANDSGSVPYPLPLIGRIGLMTTNAFLSIGLFSITTALPTIKVAAHEVPGSVLSAALVGSIAGPAFAITSLLCGGLTARLGYRRTLLWALTVFAVAGMASMLWANLGFLLIMRAIVGVAAAFIINAGLLAVGTIIAPDRRKPMLGTMAVIGDIVGFVQFPAVAVLSAIDWRFAFLLHLTALVLIPVIMTLPYQPVGKKFTQKLARDGWLGADLVVAAVLSGTAMYIVGVFGPLYLAQLGVTDPLVRSLAPTISMISVLIGSSSFMLFSRWVSLSAYFAFTLSCQAVGLTIEGLSSDVSIYLIGAFISGLGAGIMGPALNAAAMARSPRNPGPTLGMANCILFGSTVLFPLIALPFSNAMGGTAHAILGWGSLCGLAAVVFIWRAVKSAF